ncbi:hypothetical protein VDQ57_011915 [Xanthomonas campestris pv. campestris]|nr:hypothetical protein VDQ57_011915 [Xanthomonas campestris pv. campestris]
MVGSRLAGHHKDACADHRADAEHDQVLGGEGPLQRRFALQAAFDRFARIHTSGGLDRFDPQQRLQHSVHPKWQNEGARAWAKCAPHPDGTGKRPTLPKLHAHDKRVRSMNGDNGRWSMTTGNNRWWMHPCGSN